MICPYCETHIKDGSLICPACHADVAQTSSFAIIEAHFCESCGALLPQDASVCPKCHTPVSDHELVSKSLQRDLSESLLPESVIPSQEEIANPYGDEQPFRISSYLVASLVAIALVGGLFMWGAQHLSKLSQTPAKDRQADVSMAGFPGLLEILSGQDKKAATANAHENASKQESLAELLTSYWEELRLIADRIDNNEKSASEFALQGSLAKRQMYRDEAETIALDLSNLIQALSEIDPTRPDYERMADNIFQLKTLGNYLRNQLDAIRQMWDVACSYGDSQADEEALRAPINKQIDAQSGRDVYRMYFEQHYESCKPPA